MGHLEMRCTESLDPCLLPPAGPLPGYSIPVLSDASLLQFASGDEYGSGGTTEDWGRLGWGRRSCTGPTRRREACTAYVPRVAGGSGLPKGSSGSEPAAGGPGGAGGGDVAEAQAGGASDEGGVESARATPREVLETPAAARVQVSAGVRGRRRGWAWVGVARQCVLLCAEPGAGSRVTQPRAPRPAPRFCTRLGSCPARVPSQG